MGTWGDPHIGDALYQRTPVRPAEGSICVVFFGAKPTKESARGEAQRSPSLVQRPPGPARTLEGGSSPKVHGSLKGDRIPAECPGGAPPGYIYLWTVLESSRRVLSKSVEIVEFGLITRKL